MTSTESEKPLLYVVDDDAELRASLTEYLSARGLDVVALPSADAMLRRIKRRPPDLVILDVMMPGTGGLRALRALRQAENEVPVIVLTARSAPEDRITGLTIGADDYIGKPFVASELLARIQAVLRRCPRPDASLRGPAPGEPIQFGPFVIDPRARRLTCEGQPLDILLSDFALLRVLASNPFKPLARDRLVELTGARITDKGVRAIDVQILRLRRLIEPDPTRPRILQTVRGVGYAFVPP